MQINTLIKDAHENALKHGFWEDYKIVTDMLDNVEYDHDFDKKLKSLYNNAVCTRLMLIVGEVAEAMEGLRKDDMENFKEELADIQIRLADLCGGLGIDLDTEVRKKMDKNLKRPYKHGKAF